MGGTYVLDVLWHMLGIGETITRLLASRPRDRGAERALFALVANRTLSPSSKLAASEWMNEDAEIPGLAAVTDDVLYCSMDFLLEIAPTLEKAVFHRVAHLLNLEVDLLFFDTTSTYFCIDEADLPVERDGRGEALGDAGDGSDAVDALPGRTNVHSSMCTGPGRSDDGSPDNCGLRNGPAPARLSAAGSQVRLPAQPGPAGQEVMHPVAILVH